MGMGAFTTAALLAGGNSFRMGFDKQLFHARKERLFAHLLPTLLTKFEDVMVVTGEPEIYGGMGVRPIRDIIPGWGPLSGIHAAVSEAKGEYVYIMACDMPIIDISYIDHMIQKLTVSPACACVTRKADRIEPFHGFYGKGALPVMESDLLAGKSSVYYLLQKVDALYVAESEARRFTPDWSLFCNLNTPNEYAVLLEATEA